MAVALAVPAAAFSGMAIPLPTAVERIAAALVSGRTDIVSDVDAAAIQAAQAAALEETAPHESDAVFVEPNATPTALAAQVAAVSASADVPTASASPAPLDLHLNAATIVSLAGLSPGSNPVAGWTGAAPDPTASPPGGSANGGGGDDSGGGDGGSNGDGGSGGSGPGDPPGEEAEPIPTLETPATRSKAPKDALDDACADTKAPKKAPKKVQKANHDQSSSGFDAQDSESAPPDGVTFIDAVAPNLDVWVTTEEAKESVPPASADTDSTTLETDEDAGAEASVEARGGDVSESPAKTEDDDSRPSTDTSRVDPAGPETAGQGQSDDPKKSS